MDSSSSIALARSRMCVYAVGLTFLLFNSYGSFVSEAQLLPDSEVQALQQISRTYGISRWNVSRNSCQTGQGLNFNTTTSALSNVTCPCTYDNSTVCHVTNIQLKYMNLSGPLPEEFVNLTFLREIELAENYFNGSIPISWTKLPLIILSVFGNMVGGSIPREIGNMATLEELILQDNQFEGPIPPELGKLTRLRRFLGTGNNFNGVLPAELGDLKNLTDFRIDGSAISGNIPDFIGNWTKLEILDMQGTSMEGPIPPVFSLMKNLTQLRISDLLGPPNMSFPDLQELTRVRYLILRNCSISGELPHFIGEKLPAIKSLDLSFNKFTGTIPDNFEDLKSMEYMFLTNNSLTGEVPRWITDTIYKFDISYNNFTGNPTSSCQEKNVNKISSYSSDNEVAWCLKKGLPCPKKPKYYSLFINCGGPMLHSEGNEYEADTDGMGPSSFFSAEKWAVSTTGEFMYNDKSNFFTKASINVTDGDLYKTARLAPVSLKYFGRCLRRGNYKVKLHFAEIMFTPDRANNAPGRRIFDVAIQGETVLRDFNIAEAAKAIGHTSIIKEYDVNVTGSTLEIHFYWSGKGTNSIPSIGVHGPLINAISVTPNFDPKTGLPIGTIVGIAVASCVAVLLCLALLWKKGYLGGEDEDKAKLRRELELQTGYFSLRQIKAATDNFNPANKIGEGGFGPVYKGVLADGSVIAVKQLSSKSKQGNREFVNEIGMISALQHPNLVKLFGCCIEGNQLLLIYEYMENNSLARALFGHGEQLINLDWQTRQKICLGIARGLAYLHEESRLKIVHRDIKATNVLLDKNLNAKISDFGLAKLDEEEDTHISTRIAGTIGYMAPEYAMRGYLTDKADVYSFGIVALEIVSGKSNTNYMPKGDSVYLLDWAYVLQEQGNLLELVDQRLGSNYSKDEALRMLNLGILCTNISSTLRPSMSAVVSMLEGKIAIQATTVKSSSVTDDIRFKSFEKVSQDGQTEVSNSFEVSQSRSMEGPWVDSSVSLPRTEEMDRSTTKKLLPDLGHD